MGRCRKFYHERMGRPSLAPAGYFRLMMIGYFEGLDSERGMAWRVADSLGLRRFLGYSLTDSSPDHSTINRNRRLIAVETHEAVFTWVLKVLVEAVADQGYHSNEVLTGVGQMVSRTYISEPNRGRRDWSDHTAARDAVYANRRRIRGRRGQRLMRQRGELIERSFAHGYDTGGMRRTHLRGHTNILERLLIHVAGFDLSLVMRKVLGVGTARGLQGLAARMVNVWLRFLRMIWRIVTHLGAEDALPMSHGSPTRAAA